MNKKTLAWAACLVFSLVSGLPTAQAQSAYPPPPPVYNQTQLDQMLAPVALYPDSLLAQVLMAATYPLEVVQAQRFVEARPGLQGDGLARAVAPMPWDPSVKALVQFPAVLAMMNDRLDWMQQLGQAFLAQQGNVMDTVQALRDRAQVAGSLRSGPQQRVLVDDGLIVIEPVNPQLVYVPYYNPVVAYGSWWWPSAQPVYWNPPPRYRPPPPTPGISITFGAGIGVLRAVFGDARPDWHARQMMVTQTRVSNVTNNVSNTTINRNVTQNITVNQRPTVWHHDGRYAGPRTQPNQPNPVPQQVRPTPATAAAAPRPQPAPPAAQPQAVMGQTHAREQQAQQPQQVPQQVQQERQQAQQRAQQQNQQNQQHEQQAAEQRRQGQAREAQMQQQQHQQQAQQQQQREREQQAHQQQAREQQGREQQARQQQAQQAQHAREQQQQPKQQQAQREAPRPQPANEQHKPRRDDDHS